MTSSTDTWRLTKARGTSLYQDKEAGYEEGSWQGILNLSCIMQDGYDGTKVDLLAPKFF